MESRWSGVVILLIFMLSLRDKCSDSVLQTDLCVFSGALLRTITKSFF